MPTLRRQRYRASRGDRVNEQERREARSRLAEQFAAEVATWPAEKLRRCYAQPEAVQAAEAREASVDVGEAIRKILKYAPSPPTYWEVRLLMRSHRWSPSLEVWQCCSDNDDGTCDEEPFLAFSVCRQTIGMVMHDAIASAKGIFEQA